MLLNKKCLILSKLILKNMKNKYLAFWTKMLKRAEHQFEKAKIELIKYDSSITYGFGRRSGYVSDVNYYLRLINFIKLRIKNS